MNQFFCQLAEVDDTDRSSDNDSMDEYHQKSTRTLFVGNLEKETTTQDLMDKFRQFGEIIVSDMIPCVGKTHVLDRFTCKYVTNK